MNDPTPSRADPGCKSAGSVQDIPAPASAFRTWKCFVYLSKYWWLPALTLILGLVVAAAFALLQPPTFISRARIWETVKLRLPEGAIFSEDVQTFLGTQTELLQSAALRDLALARLRTSGTPVAVPLGKDGEPLPVIIRVEGSSKSSVFMLEATSSHAEYTSNYLDALLRVYLEYKRNVRQVVSGETLASITALLQRQEQKLKTEQEALATFQRTNNFVILQQEVPIGVSYLATLKTKLSDLQIEDALLKSTNVDKEKTMARQVIQMKIEKIQASLNQCEKRICEANSLVIEAERLKRNIEREERVYDKLVALVQNVGISRNIEQGTLSILEPASAARRTCTREKHLLTMGGFGGLGLGLGIIGLMEWYSARRRNPMKANPPLGREAIKPSAAERLEHIKGLLEKGLLSKEAHDRKVDQIVNAL
jgi:uncharacterized protein involved in exopolysaccharide biosynthesis